MRAEGYGADLEFDGQTITIHAGKGAAKIQGTAVVRVPVVDVVEVTSRAANPLVNGELRLRVHPGIDHAVYGAEQPNRVNRNSLVVHWRRKDQAAFAPIVEAIRAAAPAPLG